jgi:predicted transcriptional regulator
MVSRKQKAFYLFLAAGVIWLRYADSAKGARRRLRGAGRKISNAVTTLQDRAQQLDAVVHDMIETGKEQKARAELVLNDALQKLETTAKVIEENVTQSTYEITGMIKDIRTAVGRSVTDPSRAA